MVAKITTPNSILRVLNYNEKKVQNGVATCLYAANFLLDAKDLNFYEKFHTIKHRTELNQRAKTNILHISLNFAPTEKLSPEKLIEIASAYMDKIGFGKQPFLVYQHQDAGHPHIHIVTTSILESGKRINTFNIGKNQSEKARKELENQYHLIKAGGRNSGQQQDLKPIVVQKIKYGLAETKRSITNVLDEVIAHYKFTSLPELNAVLKLYNVIADRGNEGGRIYKNKGLTYRIIDKNDNKIGVPIKASSIYSKPTLYFLEEKFQENERLRQPHKQKLKTAVDWVLSKNSISLSAFVSQLQKEKITVILRKNDSGLIYGISFIDHRTQCVFNGSDLGKIYSASGIQMRLGKEDAQKENQSGQLLQKKESFKKVKKEKVSSIEQKNQAVSNNNSLKNNNLLELLLNKERNESRFPFAFLLRKKKRRKNNL